MQPNVPLRTKDPSGALKVILIGRISTEHQNLDSIDASFRYAQTFLARLYDGPVEFRLLGERASGMLADRASIREAEDLVASGHWDVVLSEDLSRIFRNPRHQYNFVQDCVDAETRVICIGDNLDTSSDNWEIMLGAAALRHGTMIPDTRRRVRRSATHSFHAGGMVLRVKYGYRRLSKEEAAAGLHGPKGLRIAKRPECTAVIQEMARRLIDGAHFEGIAAWLHDEHVEPPPYARRWTARLVRSLLADPILSGTRRFRQVVHKPVYRTGKHRRIPNAQPEVAIWPELAHLTPEEHAHLLAIMAERQVGRTAKRGAEHPLHGLPRSRSLWPGQHLRCAVCGGLMYYVGRHIKCRNSIHGGSQRCWNRVQVRVTVAREKIVQWLLQSLGDDPAFKNALVTAALDERQRQLNLANSSTTELMQEIDALQRQAANLSQAIAVGGQLPPLLEKLSEVNTRLEQSRGRLHALDELRPATEAATPTRAEVVERLPQLLVQVAGSQFEFGDLMREALGECRVQPIQGLDTSLVRPRMTFHAKVGQASAEKEGCDSTNPNLQAVELDLFDPPAHLQHLEACLQLREQHPRNSYQKIGRSLGTSVMTVKRAFDYARRMQRMGQATVYRSLSERPAKASRWR